MSKYKIWTLEDIKEEIYKLEKKSGFYLKNTVEILINNRFKKTLGMCRIDKKNDVIDIISLEFSKYLINGTVYEKDVVDIIIHEFAHAIREYGTNRNLYEESHDEKWKEIVVGLGGSADIKYSGNEYYWRSPEDSTMVVKCKKCDKEMYVYDNTIGSFVEDFYCCKCNDDDINCKGKLKVIKDLTEDKKRLKCIKEYIRNELLGNHRGTIKTSELGTEYRTRNIKNSSLAKIRITYKNNEFKITIQNKLRNSNIEDISTFKTIIADMYNYLNDKHIFKFINDLTVKQVENNKYILSFPLDITKIRLNEI